MLQWETISCCCQQPLSEENWAIFDEAVRPYFMAAASNLTSRFSSPSRCVNSNRPVVAFVTDWMMNGNSGDKALYSLLKCFSQLEYSSFDFLIYPFFGVSSEISDQFSKIGVVVSKIFNARGPLIQDNYLERLLELREVMAADKVDCLIHIGNFEAAAMLEGALRMAPVQIYWSTGFTHIDIPYFDGYMVGGALGASATRSNRPWWQGLPPIENTSPKEGSVEYVELVKNIDIFRDGIGEDKVLLGCIARANKIDSVSFISFLARVLKKNPNCIFLWCGALREPESIKALMKEYGIYEQCIFKGWVNGPAMAHALDIHLDAFPFSSGLSMYETMSAGRAFAWIDGKEARQVSAWASGVLPWIEGRRGTAEDKEAAREIFLNPDSGENMFMIAADEDEYVRLVQRLIDDVDYREALGRAGKRFMERFVFDGSKMAKCYSDYFRSVICGVS